MGQNGLNYADFLKVLIYDDYLQSLASVRAGANSEIAFRQHEQRVYPLRLKVAAAEMGQTGLRLVG
jgi:hypothetical protein